MQICRSSQVVEPAERSIHITERKRIYEEMHPETKNGENQHTRKSLRKVCEPTAERFTADTAKKTGVSERKVQLDVSRGERNATAAKVAQLAQPSGGKQPTLSQQAIAERFGVMQQLPTRDA